MPHHWRPGAKDQPDDEMKQPDYRGTTKDGEVWELWKIDREAADEIEERTDKHPCEKILDP